MTDQLLRSNSQPRRSIFDYLCRFLFHAGLLVATLAVLFVIFKMTF
jgi:hypothetical protein